MAERVLGGGPREPLARALAGIAESLSFKYLPLAKKRGVDRDDLRQEAMLAMLSSLPDWDRKKASFRTFATSRARFAVMDVINTAHAVSMPRSYAQRAAAGLGPPKARITGRKKDGSPMLAVNSAATWAALQQAVRTPLSHNEHAGEQDEGLGSVYNEKAYEDIHDRLTFRQMIERSCLTEREAEVLALKYGFVEGYDKMSDVDIGKLLGFSNQRVGQIARTAIARIRTRNRIEAEDAA